ncbi:MAG TPA: 2-amino-4-hydroxy-6-hydroxymethyldihydropteridine diphosphokinase [Ktedonobacterales bacterium]|nr:2-amino-4-hydroxy-6-hydroxymethyldihydropteridine diphosphokinase [Ktedonobacterales bacterium]
MHGQADESLHVVYLGLGSNLGDRDANLAAAIQALAELVTVERVSSVYDTAPLHVTDQPRFHNLVCQATTDLTPPALLRAAKAIERHLGRADGRRYGPRVIDIDVLLYDSLVLQTDELTVPHPRTAERAFVLAPLAEIAPLLVHPVLGETMPFLLSHLAESDVRRVGPLPQLER